MERKQKSRSQSNECQLAEEEKSFFFDCERVGATSQWEYVMQYFRSRESL